jgi:phage portal protein BeeE
MKEQFRERYGGDNRGDVAILEGGTTIARMGLNLQELAFDALAKVPERRICAVMRTPPVVAGLGDDPTYANSEQAYYRWTRSTLVPLWGMYDSAVTTALLSEYPDAGGVEARSDLSRVAALQEDASAKWERTRKAYLAGLLTKNEGRRALGYADDADGDGYYMSPAAQRAIPAPTTEDR